MINYILKIGFRPLLSVERPVVSSEIPRRLFMKLSTEISQFLVHFAYSRLCDIIIGIFIVEHLTNFSLSRGS